MHPEICVAVGDYRKCVIKRKYIVLYKIDAENKKIIVKDFFNARKNYLGEITT